MRYDFNQTAEYCLATAETLFSEGHDHWNFAIVASFYSSVHFINQFCVDKGFFLEDHLISDFTHEKRTKLVKTFAQFASIVTAYELLRQKAWSARYNPDYVLKVNNEKERAHVERLLLSARQIKAFAQGS